MRLALVAIVAAALLGACDPVHTDAVDALGGEASGVPRGPLHRPGQPCLLCHDGALGNPPAFTTAGTVFQSASGKQGASGVNVHLVDAAGHTADLQTNGAGNFYTTSRDWTPTYPVNVTLTDRQTGQVLQQMHSHVGRDGSCAGCHFDPQGPDTPGHVYLNGSPP